MGDRPSLICYSPKLLWIPKSSLSNTAHRLRKSECRRSRGHTLSSASGTLIVGSPPEVPKVTLNLDVGLCNIEHRRNCRPRYCRLNRELRSSNLYLEKRSPLQQGASFCVEPSWAGESMGPQNSELFT